jgi:ferredoxin
MAPGRSRRSRLISERPSCSTGCPEQGTARTVSKGRPRIPESLVDIVAEAAEECPAECIFVEL